MKNRLWVVLAGLCVSACISTQGAPQLETATFAGGCFWCMEAPFEKLDGVDQVISGYTGGSVTNPTYHDVSAGRTGHAEAIQITFDPNRISYADLLDTFWRQIDPTDAFGQFVDRGTQYRSEIFFHDEAQRLAAESSRDVLNASGRYASGIVTPISKYSVFYPAEEYHQDFYKKSPERYHSYRSGSGRDRYLEAIWSKELPSRTSTRPHGATFVKPSEAELRERLTPIQYEVTQNGGTEPPFGNEYWDNSAEGIYVDIVSGEPLFSSRDKFKSGTGWPSFIRPLDPESLAEHVDYKLSYARNELRSKKANSHLGHVFPDGPEPTGLRFCINSASLRFVPTEELEAEGLGYLVETFTKSGD